MFRAKPIVSVVSSAVLVAVLALLSISSAQAASPGDNGQIAATRSSGAKVTTKATASSKANASVTAKCRKARNKVNQAKRAVKKAQKRLKKAKKSGNKAKIKKAKRGLRKARTRLKKANEAKKRACRAAPTPTAPSVNHPPVFPPDPMSRDLAEGVYYEGFLVSLRVFLTVQPAVDPDGDPLTYTWALAGGAAKYVCAGATPTMDTPGCDPVAPPGYSPLSARLIIQATPLAEGYACVPSGSASVTASDGRGGAVTAGYTLVSTC